MLDAASLGHFWNSMCRQAESRGLAMAQNHSEDARQLMLGVVRKFAAQQSPVNDEEMSQRRRQDSSVSGLVLAIAFADSMALSHPRVATNILHEVRKVCEQPLPQTEDDSWTSHTERSAMSSRIASICADDMMGH
jgi:hypothetical protein